MTPFFGDQIALKEKKTIVIEKRRESRVKNRRKIKKLEKVRKKED